MKRLFLAIAIVFLVSTVFAVDPPGTKIPLSLVVGAGKTKTVIDSTELKRIKEIDEKVSISDLVTPTSFDTVLVTAKATAPTMPTTTNTTDVATTAFVQNEMLAKVSTTAFLQKYGSTVKTATVIAGMYTTSSATLSDNALLLYALEVQPIPITCTTVRFFQFTAGSYTADQNNRIGLYKLVGTTYTLVASIANDANLWVNSSNSVVTKTWTTPYTAAANEQLYVAFLYNNSAQTTAPLIQGVNSGNTEWFNKTMWGTTNLLVAQKGSQNDLPASFDSSTTSRLNTIPVVLIF